MYLRAYQPSQRGTIYFFLYARARIHGGQSRGLSFTGDDFINGNSGSDIIYGGNGNDDLYGGKGIRQGLCWRAKDFCLYIYEREREREREKSSLEIICAQKIFSR